MVYVSMKHFGFESGCIASSCCSDKMKHCCSCCKLTPLLLQNSSDIYIQPSPLPRYGGTGELKVLIQ